METYFYGHTRTGRAIAEKTMDDGNISNTKDDNSSTSLANLFSECSSKLTANGHDFTGELSSPLCDTYEQYHHTTKPLQDEKFRKRINPLRIHLGKRPFVDNSLQFCGSSKKRKLLTRSSETSVLSRNTLPKVPKLVPKRLEKHQFHNVSSQMENGSAENEQSKPVPRLVPKSQLLQYKQLKKGKNEKAPQLKEYAQSLGLQPMVKFKCRKCCSMSFKTLSMLKEHQLVCRAQSNEPTLSPESAVSTDSSSSGPSRVTRKLYLCSACGTYYENWNLFLHMREVHNRHICLFCLGMFSKAEKLSTHLTNKHHIQAFNYTNKDDFFSVYDGTLYLMCCVCDEICSEQDDFFNHDCNNIKPKPVPVLVSKNSLKQQKPNIILGNGSTTTARDIVPVPEIKTEKEDYSETKIEISNSQKLKTELTTFEEVSSETKIHSIHSIPNSKHNASAIDSTVKQESPVIRSVQSPKSEDSQTTEYKNMSNGDENLEHTNGKYLSDIDDPSIRTSLTGETLPIKSKERSSPPVEKEKEGGIKLKLSLNNANSPVIINSTVDPTVGIQSSHKPPSRMRRPPKRYEKNNVIESIPPLFKNPSIKMTICDSADKPFVKTTIYEDSSESLRTLNNNVELVPKTPEHKPENIVKSTIYDNKIDDENSLNRVPKLTVRVPKELLDKDSSSDYSTDSDAGDRLTVDESSQLEDEPMDVKQDSPAAPEPQPLSPSSVRKEDDNVVLEGDEVQIKDDPKLELKTEPEEQTLVEPKAEAPPIIDETPVIDLSLDRPIDKYPLKDLLKVFLGTTVYNCIYCNHVRKIAVNCEQLCLHMAAQHRFSATVDSITAEVLMPETIALKIKTGAPELRAMYINLDSYDSVDKCENVQYDHLFECFQCYFKTAIHKDLYSHNRKMHQKTILLCVMCKSNFYSYSELLCHLCPGTYDSEYEIKFRCCLCNVDCIPSSFRLMVHLRKIHHTCEVCLEFCYSQARLSNHVWKHKLHHLCYRCGIAYRNKPDITKHLFWKHGTESVMCKKCLQKKWPHVYHFCSPPSTFICDECSLQFTKAVFLKVHKRFHSGEYPHICTKDGCTEKFVSKRLLSKHIEEHTKKQFTENLNEEKPTVEQPPAESPKDIPVVDLVNDDAAKEAGALEVKAEAGPEQPQKKSKKKKNKDRDSLLIDVNLPALNLSESDSSEESDSGIPSAKEVKSEESMTDKLVEISTDSVHDLLPKKVEEKKEIVEEEKPDEQQVLDIWNNFKKYQEKVDKQKEKTPPLVPIKKHVCESDHDYCLIPTDFNGDSEMDKKKSKKPKTRHANGSSSSSSSSDSDSSCSCGSNCSCSSSSGSSSSSSSDSDSSDEVGKLKKKEKRLKKSIANRRASSGSNVDVMGMSETPVLVPEKPEPLIAESDLETNESETDEEFYDEHPQQLANKLYAEKRNQLLLLASVAPSDGGSVSGEVSRSTTPITQQDEQIDELVTKKQPSSKKKSKKKKKSRSSKKCAPIKINIPKDITAKPEIAPEISFAPNKITISLQSNTVQIPEAPVQIQLPFSTSTPTPSVENKRSSKRRRVPNKFYGYSSDEELPQAAPQFKPQQPPKLEWRKEDLPSPVNHRTKKEVPSSTIPHRLYNYSEPYRLTAPIPDPEPPRILMNTESMESSNSDSSDEGALEIYNPNSKSTQFLAPTYLNSGTSSLPYAFQRPAVREAKEGESVYCYCRCPYDEVSEMIGCDAEGCPIEWFHFECVGIMVPPKGKWYCPECRKNQSLSGYR